MMGIFTKAKKIREWGQPPAFQIESGDVADIWTRMMVMMLYIVLTLVLSGQPLSSLTVTRRLFWCVSLQVCG